MFRCFPCFPAPVLEDTVCPKCTLAMVVVVVAVVVSTSGRTGRHRSERSPRFVDRIETGLRGRSFEWRWALLLRHCDSAPATLRSVILHRILQWPLL